ncbi:phosphatidate cytidylyltransferase, partial [Candidatus Pelagibacter sp. HIMB1715]|uniref:phosphatidate cytidylyltransferase n=1 Tax=Candidatus Pelagibacter sp. HIMB1715 TaxID=3413369 RepID=UPI003F86DEA4
SLFIILLISFYEWHFIAKKKSFYVYGFIFLLFSLFSIIKLRFISDNDYWLVLFISLICILSDIGGYVFGKIFKGPKLTKYSPNKTISGSLGGFVLSLSTIFFLNAINLENKIMFINYFVFVVIISSSSQLGDIIISYFKRKAKVKNTGKLIPGHGGLLDRIDGMLFAFPVAFILQFFNFFKI